MGRDTEGARQVNLMKADKPSDLYTFVANLVEDKILKDLSRDDLDEETRQLAEKLTGKIRRKIVKQTVMTTVYGVTFIGEYRLSNSRRQTANPEAAVRVCGPGGEFGVPVGCEVHNQTNHGGRPGSLYPGPQNQKVADHVLETGGPE